MSIFNPYHNLIKGKEDAMKKKNPSVVKEEHPRLEEFLKAGYVPAKTPFMIKPCPICKRAGYSAILQKQVRRETKWYFHSVILCPCTHESGTFFELRKQPEEVIIL